MAINWDLYNKRLNINGSSSRERNLQCLQNTLANNLPDSLSCKQVKINNIDRALNFTKTSSGYDIASLPNENFEVGDYIDYKTLTYLITHKNGDEEVYATGKMQLCNYNLKFQSQDGAILSYPCITSGKTFNNDENKVITLPSNEKSVLLPFDDNTKTLKTDRRLFIDRLNETPFKIIGSVDNTTYNFGDKGLIYFVTQVDTLQETNGDRPKDRPDLGICNYFIPLEEPESPVGNTYAVIKCSNPDNEIILGSTVFRILTPTFYDENGEVTNDVVAIWNLELPVGYESYFTVVYDGNLAKIKVNDEYELLGLTLRAEVRNSSGLYRGYITLTIVA